MLHAKFQDHRMSGSGEEDFLRFLPYMGWQLASDGILFRAGSLSVTAKTATSDDGAGHRTIIECCVERGMTPGHTIKEMKSSETYHNVCRVLVIYGISFS